MKILLGFVLSLLIAPIALSQTTAPTESKEILLIKEITALRISLRLCNLSTSIPNCTNGSLKKKLAESYRKAASYPEVIDFLMGEGIEKYETLRDSTKSAAQVSQIADEQNAELLRLVVAQNQKIIELLEKLVNKK